MKTFLLKLTHHLLIFFIVLILFTFILTIFDHTHWNGIDEQTDKNIWSKFLDRFYFSSNTISSVGYGDISPKSNICKTVIIIFNLTIIIHLIIIALK